MTEYNFWDDRTAECNDSNFCPVINDYCLDQRCIECKECKEMEEYYNLQDGGFNENHTNDNLELMGGTS